MIWSVVLLGIIIFAGGVIMAQLAFDVLDDPDADIGPDMQSWLWKSFGTAGAAIYTIFECTFTARWALFARPLIEEVSYHFAVFWIFWVIGVNFLTMRVVSALFLKHTLAVAAVDEERMAMETMKKRQKFAGYIRDIFIRADSSGDGAISAEEFAIMIKDNEVVRMFAELDLEEDEVTALFGVLCSDDGVADYEEFLAGALKMKGSARIIDSVQVMYMQMKISRDVKAVLDTIHAMDSGRDR